MIHWILVLGFFGGNVAMAAPGGMRLLSAVVNLSALVLLLMVAHDAIDKERTP